MSSSVPVQVNSVAKLVANMKQYRSDEKMREAKFLKEINDMGFISENLTVTPSDIYHLFNLCCGLCTSDMLISYNTGAKVIKWQDIVLHFAHTTAAKVFLERKSSSQATKMVGKILPFIIVWKDSFFEQSADALNDNTNKRSIKNAGNSADDADIDVDGVDGDSDLINENTNFSKEKSVSQTLSDAAAMKAAYDPESELHVNLDISKCTKYPFISIGDVKRLMVAGNSKNRINTMSFLTILLKKVTTGEIPKFKDFKSMETEVEKLGKIEEVEAKAVLAFMSLMTTKLLPKDQKMSESAIFELFDKSAVYPSLVLPILKNMNAANQTFDDMQELIVAFKDICAETDNALEAEIVRIFDYLSENAKFIITKGSDNITRQKARQIIHIGNTIIPRMDSMKFLDEKKKGKVKLVNFDALLEAMRKYREKNIQDELTIITFLCSPKCVLLENAAVVASQTSIFEMIQELDISVDKCMQLLSKLNAEKTQFKTIRDLIFAMTDKLEQLQ
jgi:hypothetical protein